MRIKSKKVIKSILIISVGLIVGRIEEVLLRYTSKDYGHFVQTKTWNKRVKESKLENTSMVNDTLSNDDLIKHVQLAINPIFKSWVLFKHGTYIIIENNENEIEKEALEKMKEFGPVHAGSPAGDFATITLKGTEGWVISSHGYGMYTYVHPSELKKENPEDYEIGLYGRNKRELDGADLEIICISEGGKINRW